MGDLCLVILLWWKLGGNKGLGGGCGESIDLGFRKWGVERIYYVGWSFGGGCVNVEEGVGKGWVFVGWVFYDICIVWF